MTNKLHEHVVLLRAGQNHDRVLFLDPCEITPVSAETGRWFGPLRSLSVPPAQMIRRPICGDRGLIGKRASIGRPPMTTVRNVVESEFH